MLFVSYEHLDFHALPWMLTAVDLALVLKKYFFFPSTSADTISKTAVDG